MPVPRLVVEASVVDKSVAVGTTDRAAEDAPGAETTVLGHRISSVND